jgi:hypothetical protein
MRRVAELPPWLYIEPRYLLLPPFVDDAIPTLYDVSGRISNRTVVDESVPPADVVAAMLQAMGLGRGVRVEP